RVVGAEHVPDPLGDVLRLPAHLELDLRFVLDQRDEAHDASIARARCAAPRDDLVRHLLGDLGVPLFDLARDLRPPVQTLVVELLYGFDAFHESRELLELGPLVVRDPDRNVRFDGFLDCWHSYDSSASLGSMRRLFALPFFSRISGIPQAWTVAVEGGWPDRVSALEDQVVGLEWSPRGDRIALVVAPGGELNTQIYVVRPNGSDLRRLTPGGKENTAFSRWSADGRTLFITSSRDDASHWDAFAVDLESGAWSEPIARTRGIARIHDDNASSVLLFRVLARGDSDMYLVDRRTPLETRLTPHDGQAQYWEGRLRDGWMLCGTNAERERNAFARIPIDGSGRVDILAERDDAELEQIAYTDDRGRAALVWNVAGWSELEVMDLSTGARTGIAVPAEGIAGPTWSRDGRRLAFVASGPSVGPPDIWIVDEIGRTARRLTRSPHPGVDLSRLVVPRLEHFVAADGLQLSGWLYVPR